VAGSVLAFPQPVNSMLSINKSTENSRISLIIAFLGIPLVRRPARNFGYSRTSHFDSALYTQFSHGLSRIDVYGLPLDTRKMNAA
jgi:hypothetical protein